MTNVTHKFFSTCLFLFITLYMFRAHSAHHQKRQIVSIQPLVTVILCWWPRCVQVGRRLKSSSRWPFTKNQSTKDPLFLEMSVTVCQSTRRNIQEALNLPQHRCKKNLQSRKRHNTWYPSVARHVRPGLLGQGEIKRKGNKLNDAKKLKV
jgi:hypothetical protein